MTDIPYSSKLINDVFKENQQHPFTPLPPAISSHPNKLLGYERPCIPGGPSVIGPAEESETDEDPCPLAGRVIIALQDIIQNLSVRSDL